MKSTRNSFVLFGNKSDLGRVIPELEFKGAVTFADEIVSKSTIQKVFDCNKSVICCYHAPNAAEDAIYVHVLPAPDGSKSFENTIFLNGNIHKQFEDIAEKYSCDIGDHKSNSSGLSGKPSISDCYYCKYNHSLVNAPSHERTIYKNDNFFVFPTLGQFIHGYLLIIPNEHVMSIAELTPEIRTDFFNVMEDIKFILKLTYGKPILIWENGTGNSGRGKAKDSVVHAHVHLAPSYLNANCIEKILEVPFEKISSEEISHYGNTSYLLVRDDVEKNWRINNNPDIYIPRQYVRQLLAYENGFTGEEWNWRTHGFEEKMFETCSQISESLKKNWNSLPERIKTNTKNFLT